MFGRKKSIAKEVSMAEMERRSNALCKFPRQPQPPEIPLDGEFEEEFVPDIREQWLKKETLSSCGLHRNCSWEDITSVHESLEKINLLAGTLTKNEDTGEIYKAQPAISDKFKDNNRYNITELKKGCTKKQLEEMISKIVRNVIEDWED